MLKPVLILQNDPYEGAGVLQTCLDQAGIESISALAFKEDIDLHSMRNIHDFSGLIILGGAQSVNEQHLYPYLSTELDICKAFIHSGLPIIGLCLGAQIIAAALGGTIHANTQKEIGWFNLQLTSKGKQDALMATIPDNMPAFHFHGDYFRTPPGCVNLASSQLTECQAFRLGDRIYGFQYHPEIDLALHNVMCGNNIDYIEASGYQLAWIQQNTTQYIDRYQSDHRKLFRKWISLLTDTSNGQQ